ncbi:hypothetical protein HWV62_42118 [Athelia sp. TMB]|nr:hypothetical protein HWV62_42118 [Athelia sp. TMB]
MRFLRTSYKQIPAMMLSLASSALLFLASAAAIAARAIIADTSSIPDDNITSFTTSPSANATLTGAECYDMRYCRTLAAIVQSCIVTILACVWFAVHRNIPAPRVDHPHANTFVRILLFVWYKILDQRQALIVFVVTLLVPEWVLAWALRQLFAARRLAKELEAAREEAARRRLNAELSSKDQEPEKAVSESTDDHSEDDPLAESTSMSTHSEHEWLLKLQATPQDKIDSSQLPSTDDVRKAMYEQVEMAQFVAKAGEAWKIVHAFFVIMGGYYFYSKKGPRHPLSPAAVVQLVRRGHLVAPTADELANQSKGDALSKGVAILQTLWFVMQCIARRIEHLPVTSLEVMTLAYTVITVAMYVVWWDKPLNISCAVRVPEEEMDKYKADEAESVWEQILAYVMGFQDGSVDLRQCTRVPTFWAGNADGNDAVIADVVALLVAMVFGAVHCIAWFDSSQSHFEQQLWRASAIAIITTPAALVLVFLLGYLLENVSLLSDEFGTTAVGLLWVLLALIYATARLALIVISFTSLSMLPVAAYQTVQWTTFVPHI